MTPEDCQTLDDYIAFFRSIPEERWCVGRFWDDKGRRSAQGHLGRRGLLDSAPAQRRLGKLTGLTDKQFWRIHDGHNADYRQPTPKQRVLAYLCDVRDGRAE